MENQENSPDTHPNEEPRAELGLGAPGRTPGNPVGWYSRKYLPHYHKEGTIQSITFRLNDSLPQSKLREIESELIETPLEKIDAARRKKIEAWLDAGIGCCALKHPSVASLLQDTLLKWDGDRYRLFAWCIMPNHVHVLMESRSSLAKTIQSWKSYTARWAMEKNDELHLGIRGSTFWMREYWDRYIRDGDHFDNVHAYIEQNPVKAGLCKKASDWPWSSAREPRER
ncbi:MAG: transposase [Akkermansiaceae bacterium]|jgi:type I restriction enzyme R subunit/putative DNA methylase|nr:transposase [Akkermansiaceae bacterium]